jgi:hypothetical protein
LTRLRRLRGSGRGAGPQQAQPAAAGERSAGRIVAPAAGTAVVGVVSVVVEPARTGRPVELVRLEWRRGRAWAVATELDERTYELEAPGGAAIVRSEALAEAVAALLETDAVRSEHRPWAARSRVELTWDTDAVLPGPVVLRAVTVDEAGTETASPEIQVSVARPAPVDPEAEPEPDAPEPPRQLRPQARRSRTVLEAAIDSHPELSDERREALEALLSVLITYAEPDGTLPARFDDLVDAEFGDLLRTL